MFEFLVYNVIPISHLALIHHYNFKHDYKRDSEVRHKEGRAETVLVNQSIFSDSTPQNSNRQQSSALDYSLQTNIVNLTLASIRNESLDVKPKFMKKI